MELGKEFYNRLNIDSVLTAVELAGFSVTGRCLALNSLENRVYDVGTEDGSRLIVKFYRPGRWSKEQILEEHFFLRELAEAEIPVICPIPFQNNETLQEVNGIYYALWPAQNGRLTEELSEPDLPILGRLLARIHNVGEVKPCRHRLELNLQNFGRIPLEFLLGDQWIPKSLQDRYKSAANQLFQTYYEHSKEVPIHRIHGDCHKGNLIQTPDSFCFIDFDDFVTGPAVQDFWMLLPFGDARADYERGLFLAGYREFREFSDSWFRLVEPLRGLRYIHYSAWIAKRWDDPSFPNAFPHFGTDEYWEKETADLERLNAQIQKEIPMQMEEFLEHKKEELTNKDFFWDME
ncbi:stress response serine/threonine protein kinase YihE [Leptospira perolatii]|uniref:Stress response kinase A n=1 Tax=Leptospira perolatii TaxID=2023191 RepID=A0A2M9ZL12_9LEPT|nr:serine/threonine protein kinase [Leptospira perolatii]PJZ70346.1 stress response serine/threonine protein kinase YihE [Leptospira perolatii]PJZ72770.1 stress response serine/threonine protein kinase YihE [Leptospira perolatii]